MIRKKFLCAVLIIFLSACAPTLPDLPPNDVVTQSGQAMLQIQSMHFKVEISGGQVMINQTALLSLRNVEGDFARPDRMGVHIKAIAALVAVEMDMIALGNDQYITDLLTQKWETLPPEFGFNPAVMFDPQYGLEQTLKGGLDNAQSLGVESIDGTPTYHIKGSIDGNRVQVMSGHLFSTSKLDVEMWVEGNTFLTRKIILTDGGKDPKNPSIWTMTFGSFGKTTNITAPNIK